MDKKLMYKTPRASVRGVFLCENIAVLSVVRVVPITQNDWPSSGEWVGNNDWDGDIDLKF
jgi:hypothetical protein